MGDPFSHQERLAAAIRACLYRLGLADLARVIVERDFRSVAMPALGCGLGGLPRRPVLDLIAEHLGAIPVIIRVCLDS